MLNIHWKDWCWSWNSNTLVTWCEELTHLKRSWCWERLKVGGEGDDRGWDGWMALPTQWIWVWVNSRSWWWTGRPRVLQSMETQRVRHDWKSELNWPLHFPSSSLKTSLCLHNVVVGRRKWQPTPVFLPGEFCGQRSLEGCCPYSRTESDTTEAI